MKPHAWFIAVCAAAALAPLIRTEAPVVASSGFPGWPMQFEGKPLRALPLSRLERQFQERFPGRVGRFTDGRREIILRWVDAPTRKLHPAGDCFKASGYTLAPLPLQSNGGVHWSGFVASRGAARLAVRERIHDAQGGQWSDVSSWYWAAQLGQTRGPWWAITVAETRP